MTLEEYRIFSNLSYIDLSRNLGFTPNKTYRICKNEECIKLRDAQQIVTITKGQIEFVDLLPEAC